MRGHNTNIRHYLFQFRIVIDTADHKETMKDRVMSIITNIKEEMRKVVKSYNNVELELIKIHDKYAPQEQQIGAELEGSRKFHIKKLELARTMNSVSKDCPRKCGFGKRFFILLMLECHYTLRTSFIS